MSVEREQQRGLNQHEDLHPSGKNVRQMRKILLNSYYRKLIHGVSSKILFFLENMEKICKLSFLIASAILKGNKILFFGNGGSASDSLHLSAEFVGKLYSPRNPYPAIALPSEVSTLTAIANDFGYEAVFERQIQALGRKKDVAIGISTSGKSENVLRGLKVAKEKGLTTVLFTGKNYPRELDEWIDYIFAVPSEDTARIQEVHIMLGHFICNMVEDIIEWNTKSWKETDTQEEIIELLISIDMLNQLANKLLRREDTDERSA